MAKSCSKCKEYKKANYFYRNVKSKDKLTSACKKCIDKQQNEKAKSNKGWDTDKQRDTRFKKQFGISLEEYNNFLEEQNYSCAICGKSEEDNKKRLAVDHCHKTNKVRKLLCHHCNIALGMVQDNEEILISMISYLKEFNRGS